MGKSLRSRAVAGISLVLIALCAGALLHFAVPLHASKSARMATGKPNLSSISLPLFFEPNQGQTDPRVKFLARGSGYGLFLTSDEAVLEVQQSALSNQHSAIGLQHAAVSPQVAARSPKPVTSIVRMHLEGANPAPKVAGTDLLPGKSNYFIGNDPAKWRRDIPQYARVNYSAVYPGVDLVYYGNQGQLEYDFHVAPGGDPKQIALKFEGALPKLENGDLVLSTRAGDVRFHAPNVYQQDGDKRRMIEAGFRQIASDKIGFEIGAYDHSRELVIDPVLFFSTWLGGGGESSVSVAVDSGFNVYVAGSTTSANFPTVNPISCPPEDCGILFGTQNIFISKISAPTQSGAQLVFSTYLGGELVDTAAGVAVDGGNIYVAGSTTSATFPVSSNPFQGQPAAGGTSHGFVSKLSLLNGSYSLGYSTYLRGNGADTVTGLAIDKEQNAYVTGTTTSTDDTTNGFPASANGYQTSSLSTTQFFASKINTNGSGLSSMAYSTYFGGANPLAGAPPNVGGGITVDSNGNMYFTGGTNFLDFPFANAQQKCLNQAGINTGCEGNPPAKLDAFAVKISPSIVGNGSLLMSTLLGGSDNDIGLAIAVDSSSNPYVTGETFSGDWNVPPSLTPFQTGNASGGDAFIAKFGALINGQFPLAYFTYLGGSNEDVGRAIVVDSLQAVRVAGWTESSNFPVTSNKLQGPGGGRDAFVGLISTTSSGVAAGDYLTYLGGSLRDEGTGIALDSNNAVYVAGDTQSSNFPTEHPLPQGFVAAQDAFVSMVTNDSSQFAYASTNPITVSPTIADVGSQETITFHFVNNGPEAANNVVFSATLSGTGPGQGFSFTSATATPGGACPTPVSGILTCNVGTVAVNATLTVTIVMIPTVQTPPTQSLNVAVNSITANGVNVTPACSNGCTNPLPVAVDDFTVSASPNSQTVTAGGSASYTVSLSAIGAGGTFTNGISMAATVTPANSTITTTFNPTSVTISGAGPSTTSFSVATQPRPVTTGSSSWRHGAIYATWLPVGGLSLLGLGVGAGRKRRRWIAGALLGLIAGLVLLQGACGSSSSNTAQTGGTPAGTYTIKITGTAGSASHLTEVQLIVN